MLRNPTLQHSTGIVATRGGTDGLAQSNSYSVHDGDVKDVLQTLAGPDLVPMMAADLARRAQKGDFQAALALARVTAECASPSLRQELCGLIRGIAHPEATQVALLCLLGELAKRPGLGLQVVLRQLEDPGWIAAPPLLTGQPDGGESLHPPCLPIDLDAKSLASVFMGSDAPARAAMLKRLKGSSGGLDLAYGLPLDGDEWAELWPHLEGEPDKLAQHLFRLPVALACRGLRSLAECGALPQPYQALHENIPADLDLLGWASAARSQSVAVQTVPFEKYLSDTPYYDGSDGVLESERWKIQFDEHGVCVRDRQGQICLQVAFDKAEVGPDLRQLAEHDRFFDDLSSSKYVANKTSSLALSPDGLQLALATLDGGLRIYNLAEGQLLRTIYPPGPMAEEAIPVRLRFSGDGEWLCGVRNGHYFVSQGNSERTLKSLSPDLRGLFFRGQTLWSIFRDGSMVRLDPASGQVYQELTPRGVLPALSPDRRFLASYAAEQLQLFLLTDNGLAQIAQMPAPQPVRIHFSQQGKALVFRIADPNKPGSRTALSEVAWRTGHQCLTDMAEDDLAHFQSQARLQPHPVWDFLSLLATARLRLPTVFG